MRCYPNEVLSHGAITAVRIIPDSGMPVKPKRRGSEAGQLRLTSHPPRELLPSGQPLFGGRPNNNA